MAKILFSPLANNDLNSIRDYILKDLNSPKASENTISKIIKSIKILEQFPLSGSMLENVVDIANDYRFVVSGNYISFYRYIDDAIYIDRILYGGRDYVRRLFGDILNSVGE